MVDELYGIAANVSMTLDEIRDERLGKQYKNTELLEELDKGIDDVENGRVTSHEDTMKILLQQYNDYVLPQVAKREDFRTAFNNLRSGTADIPDMSLEEINDEISSIRANPKKR